MAQDALKFSEGTTVRRIVKMEELKINTKPIEDEIMEFLASIGLNAPEAAPQLKVLMNRLCTPIAQAAKDERLRPILRQKILSQLDHASYGLLHRNAGAISGIIVAMTKNL